jgi:multicomponent Na+:H+ antiporter subunit C
MAFFFALAIGILVALGVFQILRRDLIKAALGFALLFTSVNLLFIAVGAFDGNRPAYYVDGPAAQPSDPLVQVLILTAIVVSFGSFALLLAIVNMISRRYRTIDSDEVSQLKK